jgi:hypothetical protein
VQHSSLMLYLSNMIMLTEGWIGRQVPCILTTLACLSVLQHGNGHACTLLRELAEGLICEDDLRAWARVGSNAGQEFKVVMLDAGWELSEEWWRPLGAVVTAVHACL